MSFTDQLDIEIASAGPDRVEAAMPITPVVMQDFGFVHGGATIALLETVASVGAAERADLSCERPFGIDVHVRHRKSGRAGTLRAVAELEREEPSRTSGRKQFWRVTAYDDAGDVVSEGTVLTKIVGLARLAEKGVDVPPLSGWAAGIAGAAGAAGAAEGAAAEPVDRTDRASRAE